MTSIIIHEIRFRVERQKELNLELENIEKELMNLRGLNNLAKMHPDLVTLTEFKSGDNDNEVIEEAIKEAEPVTREPLHFFRSVNKESNRLGSSSYDSYNDCHAAINTEWRVGEFREVMPEPEGDMVWLNLYEEGVHNPHVSGYLHESEDSASRNIASGINYRETIKIRRKK